MPPALRIPEVTLCCVDTRTPDLAFHAIQRCADLAVFGDIAFFCPHDWKPASAGPDNLRLIGIDPLTSIDDYSDFVLRRVHPWVKTSHILIVQWDGFILRPDLWRPEFLQYDYIGPPWYHGGHPGMVGNGGFSLRSSKLLQALQKVPSIPNEPEDMVICVHLRHQLESQHGIQFAPLPIAQEFGCEYGRWRESFGFHGMHNFAHFMSDDELSDWLQHAPQDILKNKHARKLIKELMRSGRARMARKLIRLRSEAVGWTKDQCMLLARTVWHQLIP
ncbi:MAG TPA: DUF5672 family protein [Aquabacterium sp.]|nr:DUF5672 family protein [Aquabacterium sp.]